ncbi:hypothetical protein BRD15_10450 [Halobacteriales archaeon SW_6_65_15]|nr:MAG: hypothetical protein BRD15_10450 [Halobacteriales archaeon SW_6_65_15]
MAVVLILASGTAVSLAVTDSSSDVETNAAAVQEETTTPEDGVETTPEDGVETTPADDDEAAAASVTIDEQESDGERVVVESVTMDEGGFIAIHDSSVEDAPVASVLGNSVYLEAGTHENVEITLARPIEESQTLVAMPHYDTNENEVYDFVLSTGELDGPYTADGEAVTDSAEVSLEEAETTPEEEETTPEEVETTPEDEETEVVETTPEDEETEVVETTPVDEIEEPTAEQQVVFKVENMEIDEWSFVVGDEEEPDRTEVISNINVQDERIEINLTEELQRQEQMAEQQTITTVPPEQAEEQLQRELEDLQTVRVVIRNVDLENVTLVVTAPEGMEMPEPPETPTEIETTPEVETTPEEVETTPEEVETTPEEVETTPEEVETTPEEVETTPEEVETTPEAEVEPDSFDVSNLDAPESASVGDTITVSATVSNPNDQEATQDVAFRLDGTVIERQSVTLDANDEETVTFEIDTTDVPAGQYIHGVYTQDFGELAVIVLEEPTDETDETGDEETTVAVETTTEEA